MIKLTGTVAVVLATGMSAPATAQQQWGASAPVEAASVSRAELTVDSRQGHASKERLKAETTQAVITESHIARLRTALRLTPAQQQHWVPVEAALNELARRQLKSGAAGASHKFTDRSSAVSATATQLRRLKAVAMPLIRTLDENQKREAITFARMLGFEQLVASF